MLVDGERAGWGRSTVILTTISTRVLVSTSHCTRILAAVGIGLVKASGVRTCAKHTADSGAAAVSNVTPTLAEGALGSVGLVVCSDIQDGLAQDVEILFMGMVVLGGLVEPDALVGVGKGEGHTTMSVTSREGVKEGRGVLTLANFGPKLGGLVEGGINDFGRH